MAILSWLLRIVVFLLLLGLASRNSDLVTVRWFFGHEWRIELSVLLLLLFFFGTLLGALAGWSFAHRGKRATVPSPIRNPAAD
jgi:putative membrane protein